MKKTLTQKAFLQSFKDYIKNVDPEVLEEIAGIANRNLEEVLKDSEDFMVGYWLPRILFFTNGDPNFEFEVNDPNEPTEIILTFRPNYGS